jgi:hypothetical protein
MQRMLQLIYAAVACVLSVAMCVAVVAFIPFGRHDRDDDEAAREFFDAHGYWPDDEPSA